MKKGVKILIAVISTIVVLGVITATLFFTGVFDLIKPTRKAWTKQVQKALSLEGVKLTDYADTVEEAKEIYEKPYKANFNVTADFSISGLDKDVLKTINNSKINVETAQNLKDKKSQSKITLESSDTKILDLDVVSNGTKIGIASEDIYDKYVAFSVEDLLESVENKTMNSSSSSKTKSTTTKSLTTSKPSITSIPSTGKTTSSANTLDSEEFMKIYEKLSEMNPYDLVYISKDDLKTIQKTYSKLFEKSIDKKCYTKKGNVKVDVDGKDVSATGYYLTLSGKDATDLIEDLSNELADDEVINKIIVEKANIILEAMNEDKISSDDVKELLKKLSEQLKASSNEALKDYSNKGIQIAVYSKFNKPVRLEVNYIDDMDDIYDAKTLLSIEYAKGKDIYTLLPEEKASIVLVDKYEKKTDKEKVGTLSVKVSGFEIASVDYEIINKDTEKKVVLELNISKEVAKQAGLTDAIYAKIEFSSKGNYKKGPVDVVFAIEGKYGEESAKIRIEGTVDFTADVNIPTLDSSNSVDVLKLDADEQDKLSNDILKKASEVLPSRLKVIGVDVKAEDIYNEKKNSSKTNSGSSKIGSLTDADSFLTAKKVQEDDILGKYTETYKIGYKDDKVVGVISTIELEDKAKASTFETLMKSFNESETEGMKFTVDGNKITIVMDLETFMDQENFDGEQLSKAQMKKALEADGYTVE